MNKYIIFGGIIGYSKRENRLLMSENPYLGFLRDFAKREVYIAERLG
jgi:hypothetical protein